MSTYTGTMPTMEERAALLSIQCSWCKAAVGKRCRVYHASQKRGRDVPVTTLDGGFHDARWQEALGRPAPVLAEKVEAYAGSYRDVTYQPPPPVERPW